jgi:signal transduction histidine kinase
LVDDLRTVAQAEAGDLELRREPLDLGALLVDAVAGFATEAADRDVRITTSIPDDLPTVEADPVRSTQVVGNLLANALRHTPPGGTVTVSATVIATGLADATVEVAVADTGPGVPAELLPRIFDRFAKGEGSTGAGLGLAIVRDLVLAHGGSIEARNLPPDGLEVRFDLPVLGATIAS